MSIGHLSSGATQSEDVQQNQIEATSEENEGADGVSSEGEKQAVEEVEVSRNSPSSIIGHMKIVYFFIAGGRSRS